MHLFEDVLRQRGIFRCVLNKHRIASISNLGIARIANRKHVVAFDWLRKKTDNNAKKKKDTCKNA